MKNEKIRNELISAKRKLLVYFKEQEKREKNVIGKIRINFMYRYFFYVNK